MYKNSTGTNIGQEQRQDIYKHRTGTNIGHVQTQDRYKHRTCTNIGQVQVQDRYKHSTGVANTTSVLKCSRLPDLSQSIQQVELKYTHSDFSLTFYLSSKHLSFLPVNHPAFIFPFINPFLSNIPFLFQSFNPSIYPFFYPSLNPSSFYLILSLIHPSFKPSFFQSILSQIHCSFNPPSI